MKKIFGKNWGLKLASLLFALLLFMTAKSTHYSTTTGTVNRLTETYTHSLESVAVDVQYDNDSYFISGYSSNVEVYLSATNRVLLDTEINPDTRNFKVVADLTNLDEGTRKVSLEIQDLPADVTAEIRPAQMEFTIGKKETKSFPIKVDLDESQIAAGYELKNIELALETAEVTSDETTIDAIDHLVAKLPADTVLNKSVQESLILQPVSESGSILQGIVSPTKVDVAVNLKKLTKTVPLAVELIGEVDASLDSISYELGFGEVIISGSQEALDAVNYVTVRVDVTNVKKDTRKTVTLSADNVSITPEVVSIKLIANQKTSTSSN